jgi:hypothetical protein
VLADHHGGGVRVAAEAINGEVFVVHGGVAAVLDPPRIRATFQAADHGSPDGMWTLESVGQAPAGLSSGAGFLCEDTLAAARRRAEAAGVPSRGSRALQAARRRTSQTVAAMSSTDSASSQPPSIHWNGQNRLAAW